ncbi:MAG: O-antigen ligase family protein, partial [Staphylococcus hominis]
AGLQLAALAIILLLVLRDGVPPIDRQARLLLALFAAFAGVLVFQLIPLPPALWSLLPGRGAILEEYRLVGVDAPWLPISLTPQATLATLPALLPPLAMVLLTYASSGYGRFGAVLVLVGAAVGSVLLGVTQRLEGPDSSLYFYEITNRGGVVGFFANRNHLSTLLLCAIAFTAALAITPSRNADTQRKIGRRMIAGCTLAFLAAGVVVVKSVAGWMLMLPVLVAALTLYARGEQRKLSMGFVNTTIAVAVIGTALALFAPIQLNDLGEKLSGIGPNQRRESISTTLAAATQYLPFGAGGGAFVRVYPRFEDPAKASREYVNHAHNDYAEIFLDYGLLGIALAAAGIGWWIMNLRPTWRSNSPAGSLGRAGSIAVGVVIAHSMVDYPLRTAAIAAVLAFAAALMVAPESEELPESQFGRRRRKRNSERSIMLGVAPAARPPAADMPGPGS